MDTLSEKFDSILDKINRLAERYISAKEKNQKLENENVEIKERLKNLEKEIKMLRLAKSISAAEKNPEETKKKINEFIREIDKCIGMLNN